MLGRSIPITLLLASVPVWLLPLYCVEAAQKSESQPLSGVTAGASPSLTVERVFSGPDLTGLSPAALEFSPGGRRLTYLKQRDDNPDIQDLWEFDLASGKPRELVAASSLSSGALSEEEKGRRERMRMHKGGITERHISKDEKLIIIPSGGDLYLVGRSAATERLTQSKGAEIDVKFSPADAYVSYVRDQNLFVYDLKTKREMPVTTSGKQAITYGVAEFIAQEEMGRFTGYWWSKDEKYLAFTEVNEAPVKWVDRYEIDATTVTVRKQRYPETGTANAKVRLGILSLNDIRNGKRTPTWVPLDIGSNDFYLPDVSWTADNKLAFQLQTRDQKRLDLSVYDPMTRTTQKLLTESDKYWVDINSSWKWLKSRPELLWVSGRSGHDHIYLYSRTGQLLSALTQGEWDVDRIVGVNEKIGFVYFTANKKSPLEKHLYRVSLKGGEAESLTKEEGWHEISMSDDGEFYTRSWSTASQPASVYLHKVTGELVSVLADNSIREGHPLYPFRESLQPIEFGKFKGPSGDDIYFSVSKPKQFDKAKKYPMVVLGYGGPGIQWVTNEWRNRFIRPLLNAKGFVVASFDNRGTSRRGKKFSAQNHHAFGTVDVEDQVAGVNHLTAQGFIDKTRVGFFGWSYGGYLSLMLAAKAPDMFKANAAGAPVTDFALYDTHYTERYLGTPKDNPDVYRKANVLEFAQNIKSRVLILHGMADDNVLFTNSTLLFKKLQTTGKLYESVTYPGAKHGISGRDNNIHVMKTTLDFFERHLL